MRAHSTLWSGCTVCGKRLSTARIQSVCEEGVARAGTVVPPSPVEGRHSVSALSASPAIPCNATHELWYGSAMVWWHFNASHCNEQLNASPANRCNAINAALKRTTRYGGTSYTSSMQQLNASPQPDRPKCKPTILQSTDTSHCTTSKPGTHWQAHNPVKILIQASALHQSLEFTGINPVKSWM